MKDLNSEQVHWEAIEGFGTGLQSSLVSTQRRSLCLQERKLQMIPVTNSPGETERKLMDSPSENHWCWSWDGAVEMERSGWTADVT